MTAGRGARSLIIGVGNAFRGDDAAGLCVAQGLKRRLSAGVDVRESTGDALAMIDAWQGSHDVTIVDAFHSESDEPGAILELDLDTVSRAAGSLACSTHALDLGQAVELARALGRLPARLTICGIVGADFAPGQGLSPRVAAAVGLLIENLAERFAPPKPSNEERPCTSSP